MMGILKRKFSELDEDPCYSSSSSPASSVPSPTNSGWDSDRENLDFAPHSPPSSSALPSRSILKSSTDPTVQNSVCFVHVTVYSFPRCQGFTSVPSRGGATLGMMRKHSEVQTFTIAEHALEQRRRRREQLREKRKQDRFQEVKQKLLSSGAISEMDAETLTIDQVPIEETYININSVELEGGGFLQPYSSKQRQAILLAAGVKRIDKEEKRQLHALRLSRETCGCDCQGFCEPESCACSLAGIKCQVDRFNFPCGCSHDGCNNTRGRVEFDSRRVRTHHFHTIMRLELERKPKQNNAISKEQVQNSRKIDDDYSSRFFFEEDNDNSFTIPTVSLCSSLSEQPVVEDSCSSNMTDSSCSLDAVSQAGVLTLSENDLKLSHNTLIYENKNSADSKTIEPLIQTSDISTELVGFCCSNDNRLIDILSLPHQSNCLNENYLEDFPNTPSPSGDYYMDLSLSSESDLEFFDSDYTCGLPYSSFKSQWLSESPDPLQLFSSDSLPQDESSTCLLESLIGLTD